MIFSLLLSCSVLIHDMISLWYCVASQDVTRSAKGGLIAFLNLQLAIIYNSQCVQPIDVKFLSGIEPCYEGKELKFQVYHTHMPHNWQSNTYNWKGYKTPFVDLVTKLMLLLYCRCIIHVTIPNFVNKHDPMNLYAFKKVYTEHDLS